MQSRKIAPKLHSERRDHNDYSYKKQFNCLHWKVNNIKHEHITTQNLSSTILHFYCVVVRAG